jgi:hypothetical protein
MADNNSVSTTGTAHRLILSLFGILILAVTWWWTIQYLYTLKDSAISGFVSITTNFFYSVASIVIFMISGRMLYEWKLNTAQVQSVASQAIDAVQEFKGNVPKTTYFDDGALDLDS